MDFFYRFSGLDMALGEKRSGFLMQVATPAISVLLQQKVSVETQQMVVQDALGRLMRAELFNRRCIKQANIWFWEDTACPRVFSLLGGSIGFDPETPRRLLERDDDLSEAPPVDYTPHNVDAPKQALGLVVLAQTWAEWADAKLWQARQQNRSF